MVVCIQDSTPGEYSVLTCLNWDTFDPLKSNDVIIMLLHFNLMFVSWRIIMEVNQSSEGQADCFEIIFYITLEQHFIQDNVR